MLKNIIEFSVRNKLIIALLTLFLIIMGVYQMTRLPIDAVPDITNNQVQIITQAPSYGALDIERLVTFPLEQTCNNISGLKEMRSFSRFGLSLVTIVFEDDIDIYWARQQVSERLNNAKSYIPSYIGVPELGPISTGLGEIYQYVVRPEKGYESKYDITELRTIQDWIVRRQMLGVKGVAEVSSFGGKLKQYEIAINPEKLLSMNVSIQEVFEALEKNNQNTGGAYIESGPNVLYIRSEGQLKSMDDINNISIAKPNSNYPITIGDIADVKIGYATRYGAMCYNDEGEVAGGVVMMLKGANSSEVIVHIKEKIEVIQKTLPKGVVIEAFLDRTKMVNNAIQTVRTNLIEGALIVLFVLVFFLGNIRAGFIVASVIPLSMLFAICMMNLFGVSGNLMSLGALDFGLIVDGAVIIVETVIHRLARARRNVKIQYAHDDEVIESSNRMMNSAVFGQLIILMVYIPIFSLEGIEGKMFKPMAQTVSFALLGAFILSITYIPMMSAFFLNTKESNTFRFSERLISKLESIYLKYLRVAIQNRKIVIIGSLMLFLIAMIILSRLGGEFIPTLEEGDFAVETRVLPGSNLNTTIEYTQKAAHILKQRFPEVEKIVTKIGSGEVPTDPMPMEASDMMIILKDKSEWTSASSFSELEEKMSNALRDIPGLFTGFQYPVQMRFNELMTGARQDVVCKIYGENLDSLTNYAEKLGVLGAKIDGIENIYVEPVLGMPQIVIEYDRNALSRYNLHVNDVNSIVNTALAGRSTGMLFEDERRFDVVLRLDTKKKELTDIENLIIPTPDGIQLPLKNLARIQVKNGINQIQRENAKRRIIVGFNVRNRDVQSVVKDLQSIVDKKLNLHTGYIMEYGGSFENLEKAKSRLGIVVPIALIMIFIMLYFTFHSVKLAILIYTAVPLSTIGGIFFLALRGMPFSISAGIGFIALFGVAVLNGIVLISEFNRLRLNGETDIMNIIYKGTLTRLRPILMTAMVASLGFIPMAFSQGSGAEVQRPLATVVIGGLIVATFLTLFVLPILYMYAQNFKWRSTTWSRYAFVFIAVFSCGSFRAQQIISLQQAIDSALKNHHDIVRLSLYESLSKEQMKLAREMPKTSIGSNLGSYNSNYFDNAFFISQTIPFPTTMVAQRKRLESNYNLSKLEKEIRKFTLEKQVCRIYFEYRVLRKKETLWRAEDSLLMEFLNKMNLRFQKGQANELELTAAKNQRNAIQYEWLKAKGAIQSVVLEFNHMIHTLVPYLPDESERIHMDNDQSLQSPILRFNQELIANAQLNTKLQRSKRMPDIVTGVSTTTINGMGADNVIYDRSKRFNSLQIGLNVPIFTSNQAQINASKIGEKIAMNNMEIAKELTVLSANHYAAQFKKYEQGELKNAAIMMNLAHRQFIAGEISYLDFVLISQQSIDLKRNYFDALQKLYDNYYQLKYLTIKEF
jgi:cobalt-zinc-cadmium resistance protein CzcA